MEYNNYFVSSLLLWKVLVHWTDQLRSVTIQGNISLLVIDILQFSTLIIATNCSGRTIGLLSLYMLILTAMDRWQSKHNLMEQLHEQD